MKLSVLKQLIKEEFLKEIKPYTPKALSASDIGALKTLTAQYGENYGYGYTGIEAEYV